MTIQSVISFLRYRLLEQRIQKKLNYDNWFEYPQFASSKGLGRVGLSSCILGILLGIHFVIWIQITIYQVFLLLYKNNNNDYNIIPKTNYDNNNNDNYNSSVLRLIRQEFAVQIVWQWCTYVCALCVFHLLEFFITAVYNPTVTTGDSFLINHSIAYTAAAIVSWFEFILRHCIYAAVTVWLQTPHLPSRSCYYNTFHRILSFYWYVSISGLMVVLFGQCIRTCAMITACESFNHIIQVNKKENHALITHGIYSYIRHPSYTGFFFWCIGTQLILGNILCIMLYTMACWVFFYKRITYEEESLCHLFPNRRYQQYVAKTYTGIPFIYTKVDYKKKELPVAVTGQHQQQQREQQQESTEEISKQ